MAAPSKTKQLATDTILFGISTFGSKILLLLLTPLYTAVLLTEEYGIADLINATVNLIYPIITLAITDATLRYALDKDCSKRAVLGNSVIIIILSVLLLMAFYPVITMMNAEIAVQLSKYWWYFIVTYALYNLHLCFANFIKGMGKTKLFAIQGIVQTVTVTVCNIYFLLITKTGLQGYLLSIIIGYAVPMVLMLFVGGIFKYLITFKLEKALLFDMLKYSVPMIPALLAWSINININKYMLIGMLPSGEGLSAVGIFNVANKIPSLLTAILSVFTQAWQLSAISHVSDSDESTFYTKIYRAMHIVSLMVCLLIIPFSKIASKILFDPSYYSAWQYIPFLTLSAFFSCLCAFLSSAFRAYKKTGKLFISVMIGAAVNIILNLILINTIGVVGVSIATASSFIITWVIRMHSIQRLVKVKIHILQTAITYILAIISCLLITFDIPYAYIFYLILFAFIIALNYKDLEGICTPIVATINKIFRKEKVKK